jgi:transposase
MDERRAWQQRMHAQLFHQGVPPIGGLLSVEGTSRLAQAELSGAGRQMIESALAAIDHLSGLILPLRAQLQSVGRRYPGPRALMAQYGIGASCAAVIWAELGDCRRFSNSDAAVRFTGLDRHGVLL